MYIYIYIYIYMYTHAAEQLGGQVLLLQFDRYSEKLEEILLGSTPAHKAARLGCDFQPSWGNGAKNFVIGLEPVHLGGILPCDTLGGSTLWGSRESSVTDVGSGEPLTLGSTLWWSTLWRSRASRATDVGSGEPLTLGSTL